MLFSREQLLKRIVEVSEDMPVFYRRNFVNYRGKTLDTAEYYSEVTAEYLYHHIDLFLKIPRITRRRSYRSVSRTGIHERESNREEEKIAMTLFQQSQKNGISFQGVGKVLDYQTPLKNKRNDRVGKIDLLSYEPRSNILRVMELKRPESLETLLRCVLEATIYLKTLDTKKLIADFQGRIPETAIFKASPLVFEQSAQTLEYRENRPWLSALMKRLDCEPFFLRKIPDQEYEVV